jgi:hypothetical protein
LIITALFHQIISTLQLLANNNKNPPLLWLQLDNASGENKNRWMLAFLCWLVHHGWFYEITVCFLPPGHTHIDIDQMFSTMAIWLFKNSVHFFTDMINSLPKVYKNSQQCPTGSVLGSLYNWKGFFAPFMKEIFNISIFIIIFLFFFDNYRY